MQIAKNAVLATLLMSTLPAWAAESPLNYQYTIPYTGGATLTIYNDGNTPVTISTFSFTNNADISGNPWGTLWGWQSEITNTPDSDNIRVTHTIKETPNITIPAKSSAYITYTLGNIKGKLSPYRAAMDPSKVVVNGEEVSIRGKCSGDACKDPGNGKRILGYYPNWAYWRDPKFTADQVPYHKINMVNYAFAIFDKDGKVSLYDQDSDAVNLPIVSQKRKQLPYLNAALSFGGWSWASTPPGWMCQKGESPKGPTSCFSEMAANSTALNNFVKNAVSAMKEVNFNTIDIDWEYPEVEDTKNFVKLLQALRTELNAEAQKDNTQYYLTIAVGAGIDKIQTLSPAEWQTIANTVDHIGVMTYDFHGAWDMGKVGSNFMSAMRLDPANDPTAISPVLGKYNLTDALNAYTERGVQPEKLLVGIPMYGRMVNIAGAGDTFGLYRTITGTPLGEFDNQQSGFTGMLNYNCIADKSTCGNRFALPNLTLVDPTQNSFGQYSLTPWGYSDSLFVTYDDAKSAAYKANWVKQQNYAGVMLWDLTGDFKDTDERSIINTIYQIFNNKQ